MDHAQTVYAARDALQKAINEAVAAGNIVNVPRGLLAGITVSATAKVKLAPPPKPVPEKAPEPLPAMEEVPAAKGKLFVKKEG